MRAELEDLCAHTAELEARAAAAEAEAGELRVQLAEAMKLVALQQADLDRYKKAIEASRPNHPERVPPNELQLAFERVLETLGQAPAANDAERAGAAVPTAPAAAPRRRSRHGRRRLDLTKLPVQVVRDDPSHVTAAGGNGFRHIGDEVSERVALRRGGYVRLRTIRGKFVPVNKLDDAPAAGAPGAPAPSSDPNERDSASTPVLIAPLPENIWPHVMADPSAIAHIIVSKYSDCLPLHRQETISERDGFVIPRSTQCGWIGAAEPLCRPIVEAMFDEARRSAHYIATDATSAPVRGKGRTEPWHVFVFVAERDHVIFRHSREHTSAAVRAMLAGFRGHLLADAASIYDALFRDGEVTEVACWMHARRYSYRALETDRDRALEALALIAKLFEADRQCRMLGLDVKAFTAARAERAEPILRMLDQWVERTAPAADPRGPLAKAIGYYQNQRTALRRFLDDGRLPIDNGVSERALRNLVVGTANWTFFANENGLRWYTTFRSLLASCALHRLNVDLYMEEMLRLVPHWPRSRVLELAPRYWVGTRERLDARQRKIITQPWETEPAPASSVLLAPRAPPPIETPSVDHVPATDDRVA